MKNFVLNGFITPRARSSHTPVSQSALDGQARLGKLHPQPNRKG